MPARSIVTGRAAEPLPQALPALLPQPLQPPQAAPPPAAAPAAAPRRSFSFSTRVATCHSAQLQAPTITVVSKAA